MIQLLGNDKLFEICYACRVFIRIFVMHAEYFLRLKSKIKHLYSNGNSSRIQRHDKGW